MAHSDTHDRLQREALRLFTERGFDDVTVEEIASAAGVSHMTFFRHFPTKESVVMDDPFDPIVGEAVAAQPTSHSPVQRVVGGIAAASVDLDDPDTVRARVRLAAHHPRLRARIWENNNRTQQVITDALVSTGVDRLEATVAAGSVLGALTAALMYWAENEDEELQACIGRALQQMAGRP